MSAVPYLDPYVVAVRIRRALARRPARRALVVLVAVVTGVAVTLLLRSAEDARRRWGETRAVVIARTDLAPGHAVTADDVEVRQLPAMAVAEDAVGDVPVGTVTRHPIAAGEPVLPDRLAPQGLTGVAALIPEDHRAIAVPIGPVGTPPLQVGDRVDLLSVVPTEAAMHGHADELAELPSLPLVEDALVVDVADDTITVAVRDMEAPAVAAVAAQGVVALALTGA